MSEEFPISVCAFLAIPSCLCKPRSQQSATCGKRSLELTSFADALTLCSIQTRLVLTRPCTSVAWLKLLTGVVCLWIQVTWKCDSEVVSIQLSHRTESSTRAVIERAYESCYRSIAEDDDHFQMSSSEKVKNYAKRFQRGHWSFICPRDVDKHYGNAHLQTRRKMKFGGRCHAGKFQRKRTSDVPRCQCVESRSPEEERWKMYDSLHCGIYACTAVISAQVHSVNQLSIHGAVASWCEDLA